MSQQNHLYLVDGSGYIFRAYHQLPPLTNQHGQLLAKQRSTSIRYNAAAGGENDRRGQQEGEVRRVLVIEPEADAQRGQLPGLLHALGALAAEAFFEQRPLVRVYVRGATERAVLEHGVDPSKIRGTGKDGRLTADFIGVRDGVSEGQKEVQEGYERVLAARLAEATTMFDRWPPARAPRAWPWNAPG